MENKEDKLLFGFEKLEIWKLSMDLAVDIHKLTRTFPPEEKYKLVDQIIRSSDSVPTNIAEGTSRTSPNDKARFIQYSFSSNMETMSHLIKSNKLNYISSDELMTYRIRIREISNKINAYYKSIFNEKL